jgi:hypothetical protein
MPPPQPRTLTPEQVGTGPITGTKDAIPVRAWITYTEGPDQLVDCHATAWTSRCVCLAIGDYPHETHVWVWAGAVERREGPGKPRTPPTPRVG